MARYLSPQEGPQQRFFEERVHAEVQRFTFLCANFR